MANSSTYVGSTHPQVKTVSRGIGENTPEGHLPRMSMFWFPVGFWVLYIIDTLIEDIMGEDSDQSL